MKVILITALTCLSLALVPDAALAAAKKKSTAAGKCSVGQTCVTDCNSVGYCARMVCVGGKWERRMMGCVGNFCGGPKCS